MAVRRQRTESVPIPQRSQLTGSLDFTYNQWMTDTKENGEEGWDDGSRVWELRPRYHFWALLVPMPFTLLSIRSAESNPGGLMDVSLPYHHAWQWLFLTMMVWLYWVAAVQLVYFNAVRWVRIAGVGDKPEVTISTRLPFEPVIPPDRIRCFRNGWPGQILVDYRAGSLLWRVIREIALLPGISISQKQFPDDLRWQSFLNTISDSGLWSGSPIACSDYPPVYPVSPCSRCGLAIPAYEARCPSCAEPR
jgi:hypothetical protein